MYEDEPSDKVHDVLADAVFGEHPLGRPIIGTAEVVGTVPVPADRRVPRRPLHRVEHGRRGGGQPRARPDRVAGGRRHCGGLGRGAPGLVADPPRSVQPRALLPPEDDRAVPPVPGRPRASVAATTAASRCACSTRSSAARARRGCSRRCARSAAWPTRSTRTRRSTSTPGRSGIYVGTRPDRTAEALDVIATELRRMRLRARPGGRARAGQGERQGPHGAVVRVDADADEPARVGGADRRAGACRSTRSWPPIEAVSADDVAALAAELLDPAKLSAAGVGGDEDVFRRALEPVSGELAVAA